MSESINTLDELLNDPMVQLVMARDRVRPAELRLLLERLATGPATIPASTKLRCRPPMWWQEAA